MALPAEVTTGTITATMLKAIVDGVDADLLPDGVPLTGQVTFSPEIGKRGHSGELLGGGRLTVATSTPPQTIVVQPIPVALDSNGALSVVLIATDNPNIAPTGWTWTVSFNLVGVKVPSFSFEVLAGTTADLSTLAPVEISTGSALFINEAAASASSAAASAASAAASAADAALSASLVGAPADAAIAAALANPASLSGALVSSTYAPLSAYDLQHYAVTLTVGTGKTYANLSAAVATITDASATKPYLIQIYTGVYDVFSTLTAPELVDGGSGIGIFLPNYVDVIGVGNVTLKGELPDATTYALSAAFSPLNVYKNNRLTNLTVTAKNCRYAVHSDSSSYYPNCTIEVKDCIFTHLGCAAGLWTSVIAWGEGTSSGVKLYFNNCTFTGNAGYNTHNNRNIAWSAGDYHQFDDCRFYGAVYACGFTSMGSGYVGTVLMRGCTFQGAIQETQDGGTTMDYRIIGSGNGWAPYAVSNGQAIQKYLGFTDEISVCVNHDAMALAQGRAMRLVGPNRASTLYAGDSTPNVFAGVIAIACSATDNIIIKRKGIILASWTGLTVATGQYVGLSSGAWAIVATRELAVGIALDATYVRLY